ncbi:Hypothetical predicted protein, partial [Pelobates cultripes]
NWGSELAEEQVQIVCISRAARCQGLSLESYESGDTSGMTPGNSCFVGQCSPCVILMSL